MPVVALSRSGLLTTVASVIIGSITMMASGSDRSDTARACRSKDGWVAVCGPPWRLGLRGLWPVSGRASWSSGWTLAGCNVHTLATATPRVETSAQLDGVGPMHHTRSGGCVLRRSVVQRYR